MKVLFVIPRMGGGGAERVTSLFVRIVIKGIKCISIQWWEGKAFTLFPYLDSLQQRRCSESTAREQN